MSDRSEEDTLGPELPPPTVSVDVDAAETIATSVVQAVAAVSDTPPTDLPTLNEAVDTDALDAIFAHRSSDGGITFRYAGYTVRIRNDVVHVHYSHEYSS